MFRTIVLSALACMLACTGIARADILSTPLPKPQWTKTIGTLRVQRYGSGAPALILIPGLSCGPWEFVDTIARESKTHAVYAVTPAGFDGVPSVSNDTFDAIDVSLVALIASENLDHPVVIGHSMGGTLALRFGIEHAKNLGGVVSIDGTPVFASLARADPDIRNDSAKLFAHQVSVDPPKQYAEQQGRTNAQYVTDPSLATEITGLTLRSDQQAVASYGHDLYATDLRPQLSNLTVRSVLIVPVPAPPIPSYYPAQMETMTADARRAAIVGFYQGLMAGAPQLTIVPIDDARHFVMLDQPVAFAAALDAFLATVH